MPHPGWGWGWARMPTLGRALVLAPAAARARMPTLGRARAPAPALQPLLAPGRTKGAWVHQWRAGARRSDRGCAAARKAQRERTRRGWTQWQWTQWERGQWERGQWATPRLGRPRPVGQERRRRTPPPG